MSVWVWLGHMLLTGLHSWPWGCPSPVDIRMGVVGSHAAHRTAQLAMGVWLAPVIISPVDIRMGVVGSHAAHRTAQLAMEGEYTSARLNALTSQRLLQRSRYVMYHRHTYIPTPCKCTKGNQVHLSILSAPQKLRCNYFLVMAPVLIKGRATLSACVQVFLRNRILVCKCP